MMRALALVLSLCAGTAVAQDATSAPAGILRVLDKITGVVTDLEFRAGETRQHGGLTITMSDCRYPSDNPSGDAYELLTILYRGGVTPVFRGWMIASAPALNAMDHPRYDVWPLRCITS
ncbi:DUF2155 domain-containing protein [Flavimaricola marinus]|uniref:DUF2155 domain-containing protein n=1 Tax=Flavimaricola marinus TaxID=1819565 RepID=A0A238LIX1_9RHOB|nr:DUF2155 domain-containing protein [Flavimaricola marinus]SMY09562.1 hypothetical protein LOM8899_03729 [Flavimaricola marinus]